MKYAIWVRRYFFELPNEILKMFRLRVHSRNSNLYFTLFTKDHHYFDYKSSKESQEVFSWLQIGIQIYEYFLKINHDENSTFNLDESVKSQNQTVLKKVQIQGAQILQS